MINDRAGEEAGRFDAALGDLPEEDQPLHAESVGTSVMGYQVTEIKTVARQPKLPFVNDDAEWRPVRVWPNICRGVQLNTQGLSSRSRRREDELPCGEQGRDLLLESPTSMQL